MRDYTKIEAWKLADDLTVAVYKATKGFPKEELYGVCLPRGCLPMRLAFIVSHPMQYYVPIYRELRGRRASGLRNTGPRRLRN